MLITRLLAASLVTLTCSSDLAAHDPTEDLGMLIGDYDQWRRSEFPEQAMRRGDYRFADRLTDNSFNGIAKRHRDREGFLERLQRIDKAALTQEDQLNMQLLELTLQRDIAGHEFRAFLAPISSRNGPQQSIPQMADHVRFESVDDYANFVRRLELVPRSIKSTLSLLRFGIDEGRVPPKAVMAGVEEQFEMLLKPNGLSRLERPFSVIPEHMTEAEQTILRKRFDEVAIPAVREALGELASFISSDYLPACRESIAATDWPDGEAFYAHQLRVMTTTDLSAKEIHELGLSEVARIRGEMMDVIRSSDFMELRAGASALEDEELFRSFIQYLRTDPRFYHETAEDLLAGYRSICKEIDGFMPRYFGLLPRLPYGIKPIPGYMAPRQTTAYYRSGDLRNHEAGYFYANVHALDQRPKYEMIALALHEAVPGHHHQVAIALELEGLPDFRKEAWFTAFGEGWALYAERIGIEMGLYQDPYDNFGRLLYEMWRACRLVVDPGMHALDWTRQQAIDFMLANTALSELNIINEIDRYIAWPGQATAYKIGELKIRELRGIGEERLGDRFDIRGFHDTILEAGAVPLSIMEQRVLDWIDGVRITGTLYD